MNSTNSTEFSKKARHRNRLIEATADLIAEAGIANTSITKIIERAGLSRGMVHLHFENKEQLLIEVARLMSEQYYEKQVQFLRESGPAPQHRLEALICADLSENILNRRSVNIWYAYRGEARSDNAYMKYCDTRDEALHETFHTAYLELAGKGEAARSLAKDATHGTIALTEGMWTDYFLHADAFNRKTAKRIIFRFIEALFPKTFCQDGALPV